MRKFGSRLFALSSMISLVLLTLPVGRILTPVQASKDKRARVAVQDKQAAAAPARSTTTGELANIPARGSSRDLALVSARATTLEQNATDAITPESEPNNTAATAQPLSSTPVRVRADLFIAPFSAGVDVDVYSFTAGVGDKVYAATMTGFSGGSTDTVIDLLDVDGTTVIESDDEDGTVSGSASNIAGRTLLAAGTYYLRVRQFSITSLSGTVRPYDLYLHVLSGAPTLETEPNNNGGGGPQALAPNGHMIGVIGPAAADNDTYAVNANAGDTIVAIMDVDPERDAPEWNGRLGIGLFNNFFLVANGSAVGGTFDDANPSEAFMMTVKTTGAYQIYVDEPTGGGAATDTYTLAVFVIPGQQRKCTSYTGTTGPITDAGTTNFTVDVTSPAIISNLQLTMSETHTTAATADLDVSLLSPSNNEVVLFDDPPTTATAPAPQINMTLDDEAAIPISVFGIHSGMHYQPELFARLGFFKGMQAQGTWTLRIRDDLAGQTGTLNSWSLNVCEDPWLTCPAQLTDTIYSSDFEANDGGFTHNGTQDEWERGLPSAASTPILTCNSGVNCWKTDLDATYNNSSNQNLVSPPIDLTTRAGRAITAKWWQKYNIESASFDPAWVEVREVANPANSRKLWEWKGATMSRSVGTPATTVQLSAGWGLMEYDISEFGGKIVELRFHLETDTSGQFSGLAIDDVSVTACRRPARSDFDGNGSVDASVFRPNDDGMGHAKWYILNGSNNSVTIQQFGDSTDKPVPADYDGDGDLDIAVFRPSEGAWYVSLGSAQNFNRVQWGTNGDLPVPGDYDGDGKADFAVFRPGDTTWYILRSSDNGVTGVQWGLGTDRPVQADYDGDGKTDIAVFRDGNWYILQSFTGTARSLQWGLSSDYPAIGDFDGDRKIDVTVWRPSNGTWYISLSTTNSLRSVQWGVVDDVPSQGDWVPDRKCEIAVWRPSDGNFYVLNLVNGVSFGLHWGQAGDKPVPYAGNN